MSTKIRLKQIDEIELSGFISQIIEGLEKTTLPVTIAKEELPENINNYFIEFPETFDAVPNIIGNLESSSESILGFQLSGVSESGFYINLTEVTPDDSYAFYYLATTGNGNINFLL